MVKECEVCGKEFEAGSKNSRFCSKKCSQAWHKEKRIEKWREYACKKRHGGCENCNEEDCKLEVGVVKKCRTADGDGKRLKGTEKVCPVCGTRFVGKGRQKYCSAECAQSVCPETRFTVNSSLMLLDRTLGRLADEDALEVEKWLLKNSNDKALRLHLENRRKGNG